MELYLIFAAIIMFIVLPIVFHYEDKRFKNVEFDRHADDAIAIANS